MQKGDLVTVTATVKGQEAVEDGVKLSLDIPEFQTKYPVIVKTDAETALAAPVGMTLSMQLNRENLKANADGGKPWQFYYGLHKIGEPQWTQEPAPAPATQEQAASPGSTERPAYVSDRERNDSIIRQVAVKAATDLLVSGVVYHAADEPPYSQWDGWFSHIASRILGVPPLVAAALAAGGQVATNDPSISDETDASYVPPEPDGDGA